MARTTFDVQVIDAVTNNAITRFEVKVVVESGDDYRAWHLSKRFSEFADMHTQMLRRFGQGGLPKLPKKTMMKKYDPVFVSERKNSLDSYMKDITAREYILNCSVFRSFIQFEQNMPDYIAYTVRCLQQFNEKYQLHFDPPVDFKSGCKFTIYDFVVLDDNTVITCCGDDSSVSRLDTYLNKFRLPWEPEIKSLYNGSINLWVRTRNVDTQSKYDQVHKEVPKMAWSMLESQATALAYCPLSRKLFVGDAYGKIVVYSIAHDKKAFAQIATTTPVHTGRITSMIVHSESQRLYAAGYDKIVSVFSTENYAFIGKISTGSSWISHMCFSKSENRLYCATYGQKVVELDVTNKAGAPDFVGEYSGHSGSVRCLEPDWSGKLLYSGGFDNCICVWSVEDDKRPRLVDKWANPAADYKIKSIVWAPSIHCLISGGDSGFVQLWNAEKGKCRFSWRAHSDGIQKIHWNDDLQLLTTSCTGGSLKVWHVPDPSRPPPPPPDRNFPSDEFKLDSYTNDDFQPNDEQQFAQESSSHNHQLVGGDQNSGAYLLEVDRDVPRVVPQTYELDRPRYLFSRRFYSNMYFGRLVRYRQQATYGINNAELTKEKQIREELNPNIEQIASRKSVQTQMMVLSPRMTPRGNISL